MTEITDTEYLNTRLEACAATLEDYRDSWTAARNENRQLRNTLEQIKRLAYMGEQPDHQIREEIINIIDAHNIEQAWKKTIGARR